MNELGFFVFLFFCFSLELKFNLRVETLGFEKSAVDFKLK